MFKQKFKKQPEVMEEDLEEEELEEEIEEQEEIVPEKPTKRIAQVQPKIIQESKQVETWTVQEVPTQTQPIIYNVKTKKMFTFYEALVELLNRTEE